MKALVKKILGKRLSSKMGRFLKNRKLQKLKSIPFTVDDLVFVLKDICKVKEGDVLFVHSSVENLAVGIPPHKIIEVLFDIIGPEGTILMPSYPKLLSYDFLKSGEIWDVRNTPSYTGILTEIFRRMGDVKRSLHPTKSVAACGPLRDYLISEHHTNIRPYSEKSPYFKFIRSKGKAIGLGVSAHYLSLVHTIDDYLGDDFPVEVYHREIFDAKVIDYGGNEIIVRTLAHNSEKMKHNIPRFIRRFLSKEQGDSFTYKGRDFFYVDSEAFFNTGVELAKRGITIYSRKAYKSKD